MPDGATVTRPGTTIVRQMGAGAELMPNIKLALIVVACSDVFLTVVLLTAIKTGWWALPILGLVVGFLVGFFGLMICERFGVGLPDWATWTLGNLWGISCFLG